MDFIDLMAFTIETPETTLDKTEAPKQMLTTREIISRIRRCDEEQL